MNPLLLAFIFASAFGGTAAAVHGHKRRTQAVGVFFLLCALGGYFWAVGPLLMEAL